MSPSPKKTDWALIKRMWPYARPDKALFGLAIVLTPASMALSLVQPWLLKRAVDDHITPGVPEGLQTVAGLYLAAILAGYAVDSLYAVALGVGGQRTILRLREAIFRHLLSLAPAFFDKRPAGELLTRATNDVESLGESLTSGVITIILDILMVVGVLTAMFMLEWRMTLVLLAVAPVLAVTIDFCRRRLRVAFDTIRNTLSGLNAYMAERVTGMAIVQLFNDEPRTIERFKELNRPYRNACIRSNVYDAFMYAVVDGVGSICIAIMLWYATSDLFEATVTAGLLVAFIDYLNRLFRPLRQFSGKIAIIQRAAAALSKIFGLLDQDDHIDSGEVDADHIDGRIVLEDVKFAYKTGEDVLKGVSLRVEPGEVLAIVGPTGCGKSTITRLLNRAYSGYRGHITLDGYELTQLHLDDVRKAVAVVRQDIHLFPETVRFNVAMGDEQLGFDQLEAAAELVNAKAFIDAMPNKWDEQMKERGANLSVGQGQLLTFARTMAYDAPIVILDEATASVDPVTEGLIQEAIANILERKTVIVIAHRLSTITQADRIVVMGRGVVQEVGTHDELLAAGGHYAELVEAGME